MNELTLSEQRRAIQDELIKAIAFNDKEKWAIYEALLHRIEEKIKEKK